jgi:Kef-type K+ transport system membrane component KefB
MSCAAIDDLLAWCTLALASSFASKGGAIMGLWICLAALAYLLAMGLVVRPVLARVHAFLEARNSVENRYYICFIFMMLIASSFATEAIGIHSFFGAFVMGLIVPKSNGFADKLIPRMDLVVSKCLWGGWVQGSMDTCLIVVFCGGEGALC